MSSKKNSKTRSPKDANPKKFKKKTSILVTDKVEYIDYKDVNLLTRFVSDRSKIRNRRVTGNDGAAAARDRQRGQERPRDGPPARTPSASPRPALVAGAARRRQPS